MVRFEGKGVEEGMLSQVAMFFCVYVLMLLLGAFAISLEGRFDVETNLTAALTCLSNVGPGLGAVGPGGKLCQLRPLCQACAEPADAGRQAGIVPDSGAVPPAIWRKS